MTVTPIKTRIFTEGEDLVAFITRHVKRLPERAVLVVTSKIVALAEGRVRRMTGARAKEALIKSESEFAIATKYVWLTVKDDMVMPSAGIDESNANGKLILLPRDSFKTAARLRRALKRAYGVKHLGVLITDSRTLPFRSGVTGVSLGYAGFRGIRDYRNTPDLFGRTFAYAQSDIADGLAAAAVLAMGEGRERQPLVTITQAPVEFRERTRRDELRIDIKDDMYRPLFAKLPKT